MPRHPTPLLPFGLANVTTVGGYPPDIQHHLLIGIVMLHYREWHGTLDMNLTLFE